jgi:hypothetical protein
MKADPAQRVIPESRRRFEAAEPDVYLHVHLSFPGVVVTHPFL